MKIFTKEWHELNDFMIAVEVFEPVPDMDYTGDKFDNLYQTMLDKYLSEERELYEEPPYFDLDEWMEDFPKEEFDPEDFLIEDSGEYGEEFNLRNPETYEELVEYQKKSFLYAVEEYENQEPFNEEEETEFFEEQYKDALEEPDVDIPAWIKESVDPRLIALSVLPESVYKKLQAEVKEKTPRYEELEKRIEDYYDSQDDEEDNPVRERVDEVLCDLECEELISAGEKDDDYIIEIVTWDDDAENQIEKYAVFSNVEIIEEEEAVIETSRDEDGDIVSNYFIRDYELYDADGRYEVHLLFDGQNVEGKYVTLRCDDIFFE